LFASLFEVGTAFQKNLQHSNDILLVAFGNAGVQKIDQSYSTDFPDGFSSESAHFHVSLMKLQLLDLCTMISFSLIKNVNFKIPTEMKKEVIS